MLYKYYKNNENINRIYIYIIVNRIHMKKNK